MAVKPCREESALLSRPSDGPLARGSPVGSSVSSLSSHVEDLPPEGATSAESNTEGKMSVS